MESRGRVRGYNHNFRYRGSVLHVQSEASGSGALQVTTHLFLGGTVLASRRKSLEQGASVDEMDETMRAQHKDVLRELCRGSLDETLGRLLEGGVAPAEPASEDEPEASEPHAATRHPVTAARPRAEDPDARETPGSASEPVGSAPEPSPHRRVSSASRRRALTSYRHSIRRRGLLLGVRTIDLGPEPAEIVTELLHGTSVLAIRRCSYENDESAEAIVTQMQEQHKAVLLKVRRGGFDPRLPIFAAEPLHASHR